jgi:nicotinamidase/pyrazinamidase
MCVVSCFKSFVSHFKNLPERNFQRLKAKEQVIVEMEQSHPDYFKTLPNVIKASFFDRSVFGNLNYARFHQEQGGVRRYYIYAVPHLFTSAIASVVAVPALILKTAFSALMILKDISKNGWIDATDPFLNNAYDLGDAAFMAATGLAFGIAKLAISIFRDPYQIYLEKRELRNNPEGNVALIGVDLQKTFVKGGNLAVPEGELIAGPSAELMNAAGEKDIIALTQDWHGRRHISFAVNSGLRKFSSVEVSGLKGQTLWPAHGMQGTEEAGFLDGLPLKKVHFVVKKGYADYVDSYSGFFDNNKINATPLHELLQSMNVKKLIQFGIATNVCVNFTAVHAKELGYDVVIVEDASRGTNSDDVAKAKAALEQTGVRFVNTRDVIQNGKLVFPAPAA